MSSLQIIGAKQLSRRFRNSRQLMRQHYGTAMKKSVITIESNTRPLTPVGVSGRLRNSIGSEVRNQGANIRGVVGSTMREIYPSVMEFGRRPGTMPPPQALERWVKLRLRVPDNEVRGTAYVVARAIARRGIRGRFFLRQGFRKSASAISRYFALGTQIFVRGLAGNRGR